MMLHRHFEAARAEAEERKPSAAAGKDRLEPARDIAEGEDILTRRNTAKPERASRKR